MLQANVVRVASDDLRVLIVDVQGTRVVWQKTVDVSDAMALIMEMEEALREIRLRIPPESRFMQGL